MEVGPGCSGGHGAAASSPLRGELWLKDVPAARGAAVVWQPREKCSSGIRAVLLSPRLGVSPVSPSSAKSTAREADTEPK